MDNATFRKQKSALTRAINSKDPENVIRACTNAVQEWETNGPWPDDWMRWQRALDDICPLGQWRNINLMDLI